MVGIRKARPLLIGNYSDQGGKDKIRNGMTYVSLPLREGMTFPTALAAPVEEGMMLLPTERPPRQSLWEGPSTVF